MTTFAEHRTFLQRAVRRPDLVGAPAPTGAELARQISTIVPPSGTVVELGAGTGALTRAVAARVTPAVRFVAIEIDPVLAEHVRRTQPGVEVLTGDAVELLPDRVDAIVSSLPWTFVPGGQRRRMLDRVAGSLAPGGVFATIVTLTALPNRVRTLRTELDERFGEVVATAPVWRNMPPARLLVCRRPC